MTTAEAAYVVNAAAQVSTNSDSTLLADISSELEQLMSNLQPRNWPLRGSRIFTQFNRGFHPNIGNTRNGCFTCGDRSHYRRECPKAQGTHWRGNCRPFQKASRGGRGRARGNANSEANMIDGDQQLRETSIMGPRRAQTNSVAWILQMRPFGEVQLKKNVHR